jgi:hypothetical protein
MKKLIILLAIFQIILTAQSANSIYKNDINSIVLTHNGIKYVAFDLQSAEILEARDRMLWDYEKQCEILEGNLFLAETKLQQKSLSDKFKTWGLVGLGAYAVVTTLIILAK